MGKKDAAMEIRLLGPEDAGRYKEIRLKALQTSPEAYSASYEEELAMSLEEWNRRLAANEHTFTFGAILKSRLAGIATLVLGQKKKLAHRAQIVAVYVAPETRGKGLAKQLMTEAIKKAKETERVEQIHLTVTASNEPARSLYAGLGFQTYGFDKQAIKLDSARYLDEELMVLYLDPPNPPIA
ncbi:GNAT family N-acetyltransferase [Paenibacillus aurantius]|uniref:GNAT family N-acetyltransferase n=1 Tax=Paenibacillus aurantius TaxID=2918900 RepID=A0AA96LEL0_9BACL|nr:GNAT family N-acetyltransferase [Paenibacillus aurantius]WNQ10651.1 GNAT family N-acetyltransferase [Paenibacillus aurantius]